MALPKRVVISRRRRMAVEAVSRVTMAPDTLPQLLFVRTSESAVIGTASLGAPSGGRPGTISSLVCVDKPVLNLVVSDNKIEPEVFAGEARAFSFAFALNGARLCLVLTSAENGIGVPLTHYACHGVVSC